RIFETFLWNSRYIMLLPVIFGVLIALALFILATFDAISTFVQVFSYLDPALSAAARVTLRNDVIAEVVGTLDTYLIAALMLIFALGFYELFIDKLDVLEGSEFASRLLLIRSFDDLKERLSNVVLVVLIVKFFQQAIKLKYESVVDILLLAVGIALLGVALFLTRKPKSASSSDEKKA
ncbi:MAG: YqhA family protein, partial [Chloroflexota bacterium]|nr:YqhA family protein [Chloroflexota bacterium]